MKRTWRMRRMRRMRRMCLLKHLKLEGRKEMGGQELKKKTSDYKGYFTRTKPESNATLMHRHNNSKELTIRADDQ